MSTYRIFVRHDTRYMLRQVAKASTANALEQLLDGASVSQPHRAASGQWNIELRRTSHHEALDDIAIAVQQLGFTLLQATVEETVDRVVEGLVLGALGGGLSGA